MWTHITYKDTIRSTENGLPISSLISEEIQQIIQILQKLFSATPIKGKSDMMYKRFIQIYIQNFNISNFDIIFGEAVLASSKYWDKMRVLGTQSET